MCDKAAIRDPTFEAWINSFHDFISPEDGEIYVIRSPGDLNTLHEDLNHILGE